MNYYNIAAIVIVPLTFLGTMVTIYYTRKNLKTTKYIETITSQRILWIEGIRKEVSNLAVLVNRYVFYRKKKVECVEYLDEIRTESGYDNPYEENIGSHYKKLIKDADNEKEFLETKFSEISTSEIIEKAYLLILKLNPVENQLLIELLYKVIDFFNDENKAGFDQEIQKACSTIISETQSVLKKEWEKVKNEVKKGK